MLEMNKPATWQVTISSTKPIRDPHSPKYLTLVLLITKLSQRNQELCFFASLSFAFNAIGNDNCDDNNTHIPPPVPLALLHQRQPSLRRESHGKTLPLVTLMS